MPAMPVKQRVSFQRGHTTLFDLCLDITLDGWAFKSNRDNPMMRLVVPCGSRAHFPKLESLRVVLPHVKFMALSGDKDVKEVTNAIATFLASEAQDALHQVQLDCTWDLQSHSCRSLWGPLGHEGGWIRLYFS